MLGDVVELSVVVRDLDKAVERFTRLFGLKVHRRGTSEEFGFKNAILPTGIGHIELLQPTDPTKPVARFLEKHGEGVYLVGFEVEDIPTAVSHLRAPRRSPTAGPGVGPPARYSRRIRRAAEEGGLQGIARLTPRGRRPASA